MVAFILQFDLFCLFHSSFSFPFTTLLEALQLNNIEDSYNMFNAHAQKNQFLHGKEIRWEA